MGQNIPAIVTAASHKRPMDAAVDASLIVAGGLMIRGGLRKRIKYDSEMRETVVIAKEEERIADAKRGKIIDLPLPTPVKARPSTETNNRMFPG